MRHGGVVGVNEPHDRATFGAFDRPRDRARTRQSNVTDHRARGEVTQGHLTNSVPSVCYQQLRHGNLGAIEHRKAIEYGILIFSNEIDPMLRSGRCRIAHRNSSAGRIKIGADVEPAIATGADVGVCVNISLHQRECGCSAGRLRQIGNPQVIARLSAF